ncbi:MAG: hypothetical protein JO136_08680 [Hyphomicrobiales bacterium]|nr:hypothetical protein [Hyphomicrobiales bacterium]
MNALVEGRPPPRPLHILAVHGMGTTAPDQFETFILALANRLHLVQVLGPFPESDYPRCPGPIAAPGALVRPLPTPITITGVPSGGWAQLYTYNFAAVKGDSCRPALAVSFLLWAPLTRDIKKNFLEETDAPPPQKFADIAKGFIDGYLGDVVLYGGTYRDNVMRPSVQKALCIVTRGAPSEDGKHCTPGPYRDPTIIVTHSLGGYMMIDTIGHELGPDQHGDCDKALKETAAGRILTNTDYIFMMANQVAFLDLSTQRGYPRRLGGSPPEEVRRRFAECWTRARLKAPMLLESSGAPQLSEKQVVAFSDPNDILTWEVERKNLGFPKPVWPNVKLTNVYLSNDEFSIPSLFSEPTTAHNGYLDNRTVMEMVVCGMTNGSVNTCLPNGMP